MPSDNDKIENFHLIRRGSRQRAMIGRPTPLMAADDRDKIFLASWAELR